MLHREIVSQLEKIPKLYREFVKLEGNLGGAKELKKKVPFGTYVMQVLSVDAQNNRSDNLKQRIQTTGIRLGKANPDFIPNGYGRKLETFIQSGKVSQRLKDQLDLVYILEAKNLFKTESDFVDPEKVKQVEVFLKKGKIK